MKVLITVKTYPTLSVKYDELVCTAGFLENGQWIRIYPIPFRKKSYEEQYKKYDWIEIDLVKNESDFRPESYRPLSIDGEIKILEHLDTENNWQKRKEICLKKVYTNLSQLIQEAKNKEIGTSLAVFKPKKILDFVVEDTEREWDKEKLKKVLSNRQQLSLFENYHLDEENYFKTVRKLPYKFSYTFIDEEGKKSTLMIEDWELGQLYWNCLKNSKNDEQEAQAKVRQKYFDEFVHKKDLYLFLGTTHQFHNVAPNPFVIIGLFYPEKETQLSLF